MYIKDTIKFSVLENLADTSLEVVWINIRPTILPRGFSNLGIGSVYNPPNANNSAMLDYLSNCLWQIESCFPYCVNFPTRGENTLDLLLTNLDAFYDLSILSASPLDSRTTRASGSVETKNRSEFEDVSNFKVKSRDLRASSRLEVRKYLEQVDVANMLSNVQISMW